MVILKGMSSAETGWKSFGCQDVAGWKEVGLLYCGPKGARLHTPAIYTILLSLAVIERLRPEHVLHCTTRLRLSFELNTFAAYALKSEFGGL